MNIIEKSLKYRQVTLSVLAIMFLFGVYSLICMPRREDPKISIPQALVVAFYPGASAEETEQEVTKPIEEFLFKFEEVKKAKTTSSSESGKSVITVELNNNVKDNDLFWNKLRNELLVLKQQKLPTSVIGPIVNSEFGDTEALIIGLSAQDVPIERLAQYARLLEDDLRLVPSVSKIKRDGERDEVINVAFDDLQLSQYGLNPQDIRTVLRSQNGVFPTGSIKTGATEIAFHTNGYYNSIDELENQIVGSSRTGQDVRLKDVARIFRDYEEPKSLVKVGNQSAIIVSVESMAGKNLEDFGKDVDKAIEDFKTRIPAEVNISYISNQPEIVHDNISHFIREFFIAIVTVIIIIMLMLPFRIALVASMAIPMTVAITLAMMNICGIELQQVSLAALITVLGLVVDDAIVVADNYVELLDEGESRWNAAWKSASELVVPILVATVTIIFAFIPMVSLTGAIGEFIRSLPLTVSIALASSFFVAMFLTPFLCYVFIKKGLHNATDEYSSEKRQRKSLLDMMQSGYNAVLDWCISHKALTLFFGLTPVILAVFLFRFGIRQQFMPSAERNQFVIELWMPTGTRIESTAAAADKLVSLFEGDNRVVTSASFIGMSAPRFYYNLSPEFPTANYAQIVVNTTSNETTLELAEDLSSKVEEAVPEGRPQVRLMQQGKPLKAQIEVCIWGDDITKLKAIGEQVDSILQKTDGAAHIRNDFHEDSYTLDFRLKSEAQRLGFTNQAVALQAFGGFNGIPVTSIREGDNDIKVLMRMDSNRRATVDDIRRMYLTSPLTGQSVPFDQIAEYVPSWKNGRIMHRSGLTVLTVECESDGKVLASEILEEIKPQIASIGLPDDYSITYRGEEANQNETFPEMVKCLCIGLLLIFLILLFQFRNIAETFVILLTLPLSVFGAVFGLWVTGNNFGFTAFIGIICLSGIVVRNSIILIDHIHELVNEHGMNWKTATIESGKRRLRPIFLTAMAAAFGVIPMIVSGSSMWSPLASAIAFGVVWGMVIALLVVPVIYLIWIVPIKSRTITAMPLMMIVFFMGSSINANAQHNETVLTLDYVIEHALGHNNLLHISKLRAQEEHEKSEELKIKRYPALTINSMYMYRFNLGGISFPAGALGSFSLPNGSELTLPSSPFEILIGKHNTFMAGATLYQPLTQQWKLASGIKVADIDSEIASAEYDKARIQIINGVEKLIYGIMSVRKGMVEKTKRIELFERKLYDAEGALIAGKTTSVAPVGMKAQLSSARQELLKLRVQECEYIEELKTMAGIDLTSRQISDEFKIQLEIRPLSFYLEMGETSNTDVRISELKVCKAREGIEAAKRSYLPDLGVMAGYSYQNSLKILPETNPFIGASLSWNIQDVLGNERVVRQRHLQYEQAEEHREYILRKVSSEIENAYRQLLESNELISVAAEAMKYQQENLSIEKNRYDAGLNTIVDVLNAEADHAKAASDYYTARVNYNVKLSDLFSLIENRHRQ